MDSGSIIPALDVASEPATNVFNTVVQNAGCASIDDVLDCLRALDYSDYLRAANSVPSIIGYRSLDLSYLPRPDPKDGGFYSENPVDAITGGSFAKVPIIIGE